MIFSDDTISKLRLSVRNRMSEKRYQHTLGVEEMAKHLGRILLSDRVDELQVAALLHDISKEIRYDEQIQLLKNSDQVYTEEDLLTKPALHSISAVPLIKADFADHATPDVLSAVANHTLGKTGMSVFDEIIFISDYTEAGRTYESCLKVRRYLLNNIKEYNSHKENLYALHVACLDAINYTINSLVERGELINAKTLLAKKYFEDIIQK